MQLILEGIMKLLSSLTRYKVGNYVKRNIGARSRNVATPSAIVTT
jgi:hypothetical protein